MKKLKAKMMVLCMALSLLASQTVFASSSKTKTESTETETKETEEVAKILDTDVVSTDDIILFSSACVVMDADTGQLLYYKNPEDKHYPASITKIMTGLLLIENADLKEKITYYDDCWEGVNYSTDMHIGMLYGEKLSVKQSLYAILLSSANEVCNGSAIYVAGSVENFCDMMNARAKELGCRKTHFTNPNGLQNKKHYTTAYDFALISREALKNETFREITGSTSFTVKKTNKRKEGFELWQKHKMLLWTDFHYDYCIGGKTGYTPDAGNTLVTYAEKDGHTLVCVTLEAWNGHLYPDTRTALDYVFDNYDKLVKTVEQLPERETTSSTEDNDEEVISTTMETEDPDGLHLQDKTSASGEPSFKEIILSGEEPLVVLEKLYSKIVIKVTDKVMDYMPYSIPVIGVGFIVLTLLLIWIKNVLKRSHHRRKYKKLHNKRLKKDKKD